MQPHAVSAFFIIRRFVLFYTGKTEYELSQFGTPRRETQVKTRELTLGWEVQSQDAG